MPEGFFAAVAIIFMEKEDNLFVCIGRRTAHEDDPWSGDMALPGGKAEPEDLTLHDVASRETVEEIGLVVSEDMLIGSLGELRANRG